jgi:hypothetical protein
VVGTEPPDPEKADGGEDVPFDLPPVAIPGGLGQVDPLAREPGAGQIDTEAERPHTVVTAVQLGRQSGSQLFCLLPGGPGGMPAPLLLTGDWVQFLVDDRIPAVTLTDYITSHEVLLPWVPTFETR